MAAISMIQNSFTSGELDPKLRARNDVATYYTGAQKMRNVLCIPQGAAKRRPGLEYVTTLNLGKVQLFEFVYTKADHYIILLSNLQADIYKSDQLMDTVVTTITEAQIPEVTMAQSYDTMLFFHQEFSPVYLIRESDTSWSSGNWTINNVPTYNFSSTPTTSSLTITDSSDVEIDFSIWVDGNIYTSCRFVSTGSFVVGDVGRYIRGSLGGYAVITAYVDVNTVTATILAPFTNDGATKDTILVAGEWWFEDAVFSSTYGYPACGTFFQGRLWVASTPNIPNGIWATKVNDEQDFGNWIPSFDDNGIFIIARDTRTPFHSAYGGKHLMFFSTDGSFFVPQSDTEPITPTNIALQRNSSLGAQDNIRPYEITGSMVYMRYGGKSVLESTYTFANGSYQTQDLSLLASHLLNNPVSMAYRKQTSTDEADYLLVVNGDGTLAVLCTLRSQEVTAWTLCETDGNFKHVVVDGSEMYFVVERSINGFPQTFLEKFNDDLLVDCGYYNPATLLTYSGTQLTYDDMNLKYSPGEVSSISGMSHLIGEEVEIVLDNTVQPEQTVTSNTVTFLRSAEEAQIGLAFPVVDEDTGSTVYIESMPIEPQTDQGSMVGKKKRLSEVDVMLYETSHLIVNTNKAVIRRIGIDTLDSPVPKRTENLSIQGILGWFDELTINVGQTLPLPMTLLGMSYRVRY